MAFEGKENKFSAEKLKLGEDGIITGCGNSMTPILHNGQKVHVIPIKAEMQFSKEDIVFCCVRGNYYLHKITAMKNNARFQIGNNHGRINGWIGRENIFGKVDRIL